MCVCFETQQCVCFLTHTPALFFLWPQRQLTLQHPCLSQRHQTREQTRGSRNQWSTTAAAMQSSSGKATEVRLVSACVFDPLPPLQWSPLLQKWHSHGRARARACVRVRACVCVYVYVCVCVCVRVRVCLCTFARVRTTMRCLLVGCICRIEWQAAMSAQEQCALPCNCDIVTL